MEVIFIVYAAVYRNNTDELPVSTIFNAVQIYAVPFLFYLQK